MHTDLSDEPVLLHTENSAPVRRIGMQFQTKYVPPLDGTPDELREFDLWIARRVATILSENFYGYPWTVTAESRQGIIMFQIPELMGATLHYVIRLARYGDLDAKLIMRCGGELLERMHLPRRMIDEAAFQEAKKRLHTFEFHDLKRSQ